VSNDSANQAGTAEGVAAAVHANIVAYLVIPSPPGHSATRLLLNEAVRPAVARKDKAAMLRATRGLLKGARSAANYPIVLTGEKR
jgi:hypothetical protein